MEQFPRLQAEFVTVDQIPAEMLEKIFVHVIGKHWQCMHCQKKGRLQVFSFEQRWDRLHTAKFREPGFNPDEAQLLCQDCWIQWLIWYARMGFDLHDHAIAAPCGRECFSARGGRRAQFVALQAAAVDSKVGFLMGKAIDGLPQQNGTTGLTGKQLAYFFGGRRVRQGYYESVRSPADLARNLERVAQVRSFGIPRYMVDDHAIIVKIFKSAYNAPGGVLQPPATADPFVALHHVALESYDPVTCTFRFWNNWGSGWGDRGYGTMPLEYADEFFHEGWIYRHARWGPIPAKRAKLTAYEADHVHVRQLWSVENPRVAVCLPGLDPDHNAKWQWYETMSPTLDCVACFEVRNGFGLRMGWAFVRQVSDNTAEITELFVWPTFRRAHIGSWLEGLCHAQAAAWDVRELHLIVNETDSVVGPIRRAARHFADARSYSAR
ncbi:MAG: hypothetical protein ABSD85_10550 [Acidimicrobiales bacterium]